MAFKTSLRRNENSDQTPLIFDDTGEPADLSPSEALQAVTIDDVLHCIGEFGRYQIYQYLLLCLVSIVAAFQAFNMVFIGDDPAHHCHIPVDASQYNMTDSELLDKTIPMEDCHSDCTDGTTQRSQCTMYNLTELGFHVDTSSESTMFVHRSESEVSVTSCLYGWTYSEEYFKSTIVSEVHRYCYVHVVDCLHLCNGLKFVCRVMFSTCNIVGFSVFELLATRHGRHYVLHGSSAGRFSVWTNIRQVRAACIDVTTTSMFTRL